MAIGHKTPPKPDPRLNPWRDDIAADHLRGEVDAPAFVKGQDYEVIAPVTNLHRSPAHGAIVDSQLLLGERFRVYDVKGAWAWGQCQHDDYVGYVLREDLDQCQNSTHIVRQLRCHIFSDPDIKSRPIMAVSMGARLAATNTTGRFTELESGGFIVTQSIMPKGATVPDYIATARQFIGTPYLWGGRESMGIDCSGLVQIALSMAGRACPRDSDLQEASLGQILTEEPTTGDVVFWRGHVGFISAPGRLLHANATHMQVIEEDFAEACERIASTSGSVTAVKRLSSSG
jgi:cell wall-associated NlpC family hydrolase